MDDILDYQDGAVTGKPAGNDLREGKFTLPSIHALNNSDSDCTDTIKDIRSLSATPEQRLPTAHPHPSPAFQACCALLRQAPIACFPTNCLARCGSR